MIFDIERLLTAAESEGKPLPAYGLLILTELLTHDVQTLYPGIVTTENKGIRIEWVRPGCDRYHTVVLHMRFGGGSYVGTTTPMRYRCFPPTRYRLIDFLFKAEILILPE